MPGRRGDTGETKVSKPSSPFPPSAPKPRAGERDPCPDPSPSPARAITKETRPPALPSRAVSKRIHQRVPGVKRGFSEGTCGKGQKRAAPFS